MPSSKPGKPQTGGITLADVTITDLASLANAPGSSGNLPGSGSMASHNIVTVPLPKKQSVYEFQPEKLKDGKSLRYSDVRKGFPRQEDVKNARFRISELTRAPLSVAAEEEKRIESEINARLERRYEQIREQVKKEAYQAGFTEGKDAGKNEIMRMAKPMVDSLDKLLLQFENMKQDIFKANEEFIIRLVYRLAKAVILKEIKEDHDYIRRLVLEILERLGTSDYIKVFVAPSEESAVQKLKEDLAKTLGGLKNITVEIDSKIHSAGCRVETDFSEVDARLEVQIENIAKTLGTG